MAKKSLPVLRSNRLAVVYLPEEFDIPYHLSVPQSNEIPAELPEPHDWYGNGVHSRRANEQSHHRLILDDQDARLLTPVRRKVQIPVVKRDFSPFVTHWQYRNGKWVIVNHVHAREQLDLWLNKKQRDWKHADRLDRDHSRANIIATLPYRNGKYRKGLLPAMQTGNVGMVADSALALYNHLRR